jgi:hypothetical protein
MYLVLAKYICESLKLGTDISCCQLPVTDIFRYGCLIEYYTGRNVRNI